MSAAQRDLKQIRHLLLAKRSVLAERRQRVEHDLARRNDPLATDSSDQAIQLENDEALQAIGDAARSDIAAIDEAVWRLDRGQYGICKSCEGEIEEGRLHAVPEAVTCVSCANG